MRPRQSVQLGDDVHELLKAKAYAERRSVRAVVGAAVEAYLGRTDCPTCRRPWPKKAGVEIDLKNIEDSKPREPVATETRPERHQDATKKPPVKTALDAVATTGGKVTVGTALLPAEDELLCRKCAHPKSKHWLKGCVAKCVCKEANYRA